MQSISSSAIDITTCQSNPGFFCRYYYFWQEYPTPYGIRNSGFCVYGQKTLDCDFKDISGIFGSSGNFCPCSSFTCNGTLTIPPTPKPSQTPTAPTIIPTRNPTLEAKWVLGRKKESCTAACRSVGAQCLPSYSTDNWNEYQFRDITNTAIDTLTCRSAALTYPNGLLLSIRDLCLFIFICNLSNL